jgi:phosphate transport system permease protein
VTVVFAATRTDRANLNRERLVRVVFAAMAAAMIVPLVMIVSYLVVRAWPVLSWNFLTEYPRNGMKEGGVYPAIVGTLLMVVTALAVAAPIGVFAAVYLNEYAGENWFTRIVNLAVVNLAGVPSIVHALFGVGAFMLLTGRPCVLAASLTLAIMTLPVIIASTKQALAAVPLSFREACWNVGASRWQTIRHVVLPNSISGILTGVILCVCRAAGETAPVMFTGAVFYRREVPSSLLDQSMTLSMHLFSIATQGGQVPDAVQYGTAVVLLGLVLLVNAAAIGLRVYFRARKKW